MARFLARVLSFVLLFFFAEKVLLLFLITSPKLEYDKRLEKILNGQANEECVVFGSSRSAFGISAELIQDSLNLNTYNYSYKGSDITFHLFLLKTYLKFNKKPKCVILAIDESEFSKNTSLGFRPDRLYPLALNSYINQSLIDIGDRSHLSKILIVSRLKRYNFKFKKIIPEMKDSIRENGSMTARIKANTKMIYSVQQIGYDYTTESDMKLTAFKEFQSICENSGIKLVFDIVPTFHQVQTSFLERFNSVKKSNSPLILHDDSLFQNQNLFIDASHLNYNGAIIHTRYLLKELRENQLL